MRSSPWRHVLWQNTYHDIDDCIGGQDLKAYFDKNDPVHMVPLMRHWPFSPWAVSRETP